MTKKRTSAFLLVAAMLLTSLGAIGVATAEDMTFVPPAIVEIETSELEALAACAHTNGYKMNFGFVAAEVWSAKQHVATYWYDWYCRTCSRVVYYDRIEELMENHSGAPCGKCGYNPYA